MTMSGLSWIPDVFAAVMIVVAVVSVGRLAVAVPGSRWLDTGADADAAHLLMAIAMAGMLTASLQTLPAGAWEPVFAMLTVWFGWRVAREGRGRGVRGWVASCHAPHLIHSAAMLYMFLALAAPSVAGGGIGGMGASSGPALQVPTVALVLALLLAGYAVHDLDGLADPAGARWYRLAPAGEAGRSAGFWDARLAAAGGPGVAAATPTSPTRATGVPSEPFRNNEAGPVSAGRVPALLAAPRLGVCCRIAMGVTMAYMLVILI